MKFARKVKRNSVRKIVGNGNLGAVWRRYKIQNLLNEKSELEGKKKALKKSIKKAEKKCKPCRTDKYELRRVNFRLTDIMSDLRAKGWSVKYKKMMV